MIESILIFTSLVAMAAQSDGERMASVGNKLRPVPFTAVRIYLRSHPEPGEDLADGERAVVVRALHPDPARRHGTAAEFAEAVEEVARRPG